jgi:hypothetical protein
MGTEEPSDQLRAPRALMLAYLDFLRDAVLRKITGLSEAELRSSRLPSGWAPLELVQHLAYMERRWVQWGFAGEAVDDPWGDDDPTKGRWQVPAGECTEDVVARLRVTGQRTQALLAGAELSDQARLGGRFSDPTSAPTLGWILLHLLQEYARHVGQLDIVRELVDGEVGE